MIKGKYIIGLLILLLTSMNLYSNENPAVKLENKIKKYFNEVQIKVNNEKDPVQKREILNSSLNRLDNILAKVSEMPGVSFKDKEVLNDLRQDFIEKHNELNGRNGYEKIKDSELNSYAAFMIQDIEKADKYVTISLTTLLLILILVVLLVKPF